ncbi:NMDA receptor-regulated protein 1-domain-containing protein [Pavlovales sp. CCMP2436]|nr:NMDA receptor-regulated protein 1-domain-containing protein [Pavlovales sp. CCMP2436]
MPQPLPPKENALFKLIVKHYETKQYKKGMKASDAVLKKFPDHGETLAMRGLILNCMERKVEAYEFVKKGLAKDIRSHVCWHVFGLVHRSDRDYKESVKCYRNALRIEPDNMQILRDLSLLQVQLRDRVGYLETRHSLLKLKPALRLNWLGLAVANHLLGRHERATNVLGAYENTLEGSTEPESAYERSEMALYKMELLRDGRKHAEALEALAKSEKVIVDKTAVREVRAELNLALENYSAAASEYRRLIDLNPEEHGYHAGLQVFFCLNPAQRSLLLSAYGELRTAHPRASAPRCVFVCVCLCLSVCVYVIPMLRKGVPSLFADIRPLYEQPAKAARIGAIFDRWGSALANNGIFKPHTGHIYMCVCDGGSGAELPSTTMWVQFLLAQHLDKHGKHEERCVAHLYIFYLYPCNCCKVYVKLCRVYKHAGDPAEAASWVEHARSLDGADRYLNTKATRYLLRADKPEEATAVIGLFTKDGPERESNLFDMQCMWYECEAGEALRRLGRVGKALKKLLAVDKHFVDIVEDQFDFHTYCLRKMTLRSYVQLLRMEVRLLPPPRRCARTYSCYAWRYASSSPPPEPDHSKCPFANLTFARFLYMIIYIMYIYM